MFLERSAPLGLSGAPLGYLQETLLHYLVWIAIMIFMVQSRFIALDPIHTVHSPRAIYTIAPLGLQFIAKTLRPIRVFFCACAAGIAAQPAMMWGECRWRGVMWESVWHVLDQETKLMFSWFSILISAYHTVYYTTCQWLYVLLSYLDFKINDRIDHV